MAPQRLTRSRRWGARNPLHMLTLPLFSRRPFWLLLFAFDESFFRGCQVTRHDQNEPMAERFI